MEEKKKLISIYIEPEEHAEFKKNAQKEKRNVSSLIRLLVSNYNKEVKAKEQRIKNVFKKK